MGKRVFFRREREREKPSWFWCHARNAIAKTWKTNTVYSVVDPLFWVLRWVRTHWRGVVIPSTHTHSLRSLRPLSNQDGVACHLLVLCHRPLPTTINIFISTTHPISITKIRTYSMTRRETFRSQQPQTPSLESPGWTNDQTEGSSSSSSFFFYPPTTQDSTIWKRIERTCGNDPFRQRRRRRRKVGTSARGTYWSNYVAVDESAAASGN